MTPNLPTEILEAAQKATAHTKGPLSVHYSGRDFCLTTPSGPFKGITVTHMIDGEANAEYLALACNNAVALAEEVLELRKVAKEAHEVCLHETFDSPRCFDLRKALAALGGRDAK